MAEWCTLTEVEYVLSVSGVNESTNDDYNNIVADPVIVNNAIVNARVTLSTFLVQKYDLTAITSANEWVKWTTALFAAVELLRRKGGTVSPGLQEKYEEIRDFLKQVQSGPLIVPGLNPRTPSGIAMSNLTIDNSFGRAKVRRVETISVPPNGLKVPTFTDRYDYGQTQ